MRKSQFSKAIKERMKRSRDRLTDLPDPILHHIFSFLHIQQAVQASVLSKRFRNLWKLLSYLNFHGEFDVDLVNKVLIFREKSDIYRYSVESEDVRHAFHIYSWVLAAIQYNVQELDLKLGSEEIYELPKCLFSCKSLTVLKLSFDQVGQELELPPSSGLPNLKVLNLKHCCILSAETLNEFISGCLSLESLEFVLVDFVPEKTYFFSNVKLENLVIRDVYYLGSYKFQICAPNLRAFACSIEMEREFSFALNPPMDFADINSEIERIYAEPWRDDDLTKGKRQDYLQRTTKLLDSIRSVKSLKLSAGVLQVAFEPLVARQHLSLQFPNLKHLKLRARFSTDCALSIIHFLKTSPNIETLKIEIVENSFSWNPQILNQNTLTAVTVGEWWEFELWNHCMFHHLKDVEIHGVVGCMTEVKLVEIILKKATMLERMVVCSSDENSSDRKKWLRNLSKMFMKVPRASPKVILVIA